MSKRREASAGIDHPALMRQVTAGGTAMHTIEADVPKIFFYDHESRGCIEHSGERVWNDQTHRYDRPYVISVKGNRIRVRLHLDDMFDLISDANHYASSGAGVYEGMIGLVSSARATVLALHDQGVIAATPNTEQFTRYVARLVNQRERSRQKRAASKSK